MNNNDQFGPSLGDLMRGGRATMGKSLLDVQRELKIKAAYLSAIENADASAFETPGFIAGYVRSYARYLSLDPDDIFNQFCKESGFAGVAQRSDASREVEIFYQTPITKSRRAVTKPRRSEVRRKPFDIQLYSSQRKTSNKWLFASALAGIVTAVLVYLSEIQILQAEPGLHTVAAFVSGVVVTLVANMFNPIYFFARAAYFFFAPIFAASFFGVNISLNLEGEFLGGVISTGVEPNPIAMVICGALTAFSLFFHYARTRD